MFCYRHNVLFIVGQYTVNNKSYFRVQKYFVRELIFPKVQQFFSLLHSLNSEIENNDLDLCSELRVRKNARNECKWGVLFLGNSCTMLCNWKINKCFIHLRLDFRLSLRCDGSNPDTKAVFAYISVIVSEYSGDTEINWSSFFQSYYGTKGLTER